MKRADYVREGGTAGLEYARAASSPALLLEPGDHLSREEFERRSHAMPRVKKAELLRGVVYIPSSVRISLHGAPHALLISWLTT
jgi:hypothetical protein